MDEENQSPTSEEPTPDHNGLCGSQNSGSPEVPPVGQNLQIVEDDNEDNTFVNTSIEEAANTSEKEAAEIGETTTTTSTTLPSRYPRREHRAPSQYSGYVPISYVCRRRYVFLEKGDDVTLIVQTHACILYTWYPVIDT